MEFDLETISHTSAQDDMVLWVACRKYIALLKAALLVTASAPVEGKNIFNHSEQLTAFLSVSIAARVNFLAK